MRHYVAMVRDELGDEQRATQEVYEYPDFDEENETACRLFNAWRAELENIIQEEIPDEFGSVWIVTTPQGKEYATEYYEGDTYEEALADAVATFGEGTTVKSESPFASIKGD